MGEFSWGDANRAPGSQLFGKHHQHSNSNNMVRERGGEERMFRDTASHWPAPAAFSLAKRTVRSKERGLTCGLSLVITERKLRLCLYFSLRV